MEILTLIDIKVDLACLVTILPPNTLHSGYGPPFNGVDGTQAL